MKTSNVSVLVALIAGAGFVLACSADGTGPVPSGAHGGTTGAFGGAIGSQNDTGGSMAVGASNGSGNTGLAGSPGGGSTATQAGSTVTTTTPSAGSRPITTVPSGGSSGMAGGSASTGGTVGGAGGTKTTAGMTGTTAGATSTGGTGAAAGSTGAGGTTRIGGATAAGGAGGSVSTGADNWWPAAFDANASPNPSNGKHNPGKACLTCHKTGGQGTPWLFGGTVYDKAESAGLAHVQVGIKEGSKFFSAYSASNGNIWLPLDSNGVTWANAEIRVRTATGEKKMISFPLNGDCNNSCHVPGNRTVVP